MVYKGENVIRVQQTLFDIWIQGDAFNARRCLMMPRLIRSLQCSAPLLYIAVSFVTPWYKEINGDEGGGYVKNGYHFRG
jgi:hypothetical protein